MRRLSALFIMVASLFCSASLYAQKEVSAKEIIKKITAGEQVSYQGVTIDGDLDLTYYFEKKFEDQYASKKKSWNNDNVIEEIIRSKIVFENCTFKNGVIAYYHDDRTEFTFTASFRQEVVFKDCIFEEKSAFKYSDFERVADFSGSKFNEEALFKYAKFEEYVDFSGAVFEEDANFKYTKFHDGVNLSNTVFREDLNLKYAKISGDFKADNMDVQEDLDVKYTKINGDSFSKYLLKSR